MSKPIRGTAIAIGILFFWTIIGIVGFMLIEEWNALDSLYMTVITISTVGFGVPHDMSDGGKAFSIILIIGGYITSFNALARVSQLLFEGGFFDILGDKRRRNRIMELEDHYIVCGYGRMGQGIVEGLVEQKKTFVVVDHDSSKVEYFKSEDINYVIGDATSEEILTDAGILKAKVLLALLPSDADNLYLSIAAKEVNPNIYLISQALYDNAEKRLIKGGADQVISPYKVASFHALHAAVSLSPGMNLELGRSSYGVPVSLREVEVDQGSQFVGKSIIESNFKSQYRILVIGIKKENGEVQINPEPSAIIHAGDILVLAGENVDIGKVQTLCVG